MRFSDIAKILKGTMGNAFPKTDITVSVGKNVGEEQVWVTVYSVPPKSSSLDRANADHKARFVLTSLEKIGEGEEIPGKVQVVNAWKRSSTPFRKSKTDPNKSIEKVMDFFLKHREKFTPEGGKKAFMNIDLAVRTASTLPKGSQQRRDLLQRISVAKEAASTDPVDVAVEIISKGMKHPALTAITAHIGKVEKALSKAKTDLSSLKSVGGGETGAIGFLKDTKKELQTLRAVIAKVLSQLETRVFKAASDETGKWLVQKISPSNTIYAYVTDVAKNGSLKVLMAGPHDRKAKKDTITKSSRSLWKAVSPDSVKDDSDLIDLIKKRM